jgi:hypothetical protein
MKKTAKPSPVGIQEPPILAAVTAAVQKLLRENEELKARLSALEAAA